MRKRCGLAFGSFKFGYLESSYGEARLCGDGILHGVLDKGNYFGYYIARLTGAHIIQEWVRDL
jgi:hypothetical protein